MGRIRAGTGLIAIVVLLATGAGSASAQPAVSCPPVVDPYAGTRYEGVNLSRIRASGVSCAVARRVARRAHYKALGLPLPRNGVRHFSWHGWKVSGDLRPSSDVYVARLPGKVVRWRF